MNKVKWEVTSTTVQGVITSDLYFAISALIVQKTLWMF